jgi:predicted nucleic acid-binding protein
VNTPKWQVLFDLNVILDVLIRREPHYADATRLWVLAETGQIKGFVTAHSFTTLFYLYRRQNNADKAYQALRMLLQVFEVARVERSAIETACGLGWRDFEDAVQWTAAKSAGCQYLVTRDPKGYSEQMLTAIQPADFLAIWTARQKTD